MTREEAIEQLQNCKDLIKQDGQDWLDERDFPLLDMAIEALQTKTDGDLINRADAIERFCELGTSLERQNKTMITMIDAKYAFIKTLESLPSAEVVHIETYRELYEKYMELKHASAKVVQGEWKHTITGQPYCSNCEYVFGEDEEFSPFWDYCPMCGTRIKEGTE